jgi:hypothetical protein
MSSWGTFSWDAPGSGVSGYIGPPISEITYLAWRISRVLKLPGFGGSPEDQAEFMQLLQALIDQWQARKPFAYSETSQQFTLTPQHQPVSDWSGAKSAELCSYRSLSRCLIGPIRKSLLPPPHPKRHKMRHASRAKGIHP